MKFSAAVLVLCATLCLTGCLSVEISKSEVTGTEHILGSDHGWKLFNWIPVFRTDITQDRVQKEMFAQAAKRGKTITGLVSHNYEEVMLEVPLLYITLPIPYIFCYHEIQLSGTLQ